MITLAVVWRTSTHGSGIKRLFHHHERQAMCFVTLTMTMNTTSLCTPENDFHIFTHFTKQSYWQQNWITKQDNRSTWLWIFHVKVPDVLMSIAIMFLTVLCYKFCLKEKEKKKKTKTSVLFHHKNSFWKPSPRVSNPAHGNSLCWTV